MKIKRSYRYFFLFYIFTLLSSFDTYAQITRGIESGELYIPSSWYYQGGQNNFDAIFYSDNYGETLKINYVNNIGSGNMPVGSLISDATAG